MATQKNLWIKRTVITAFHWMNHLTPHCPCDFKRSVTLTMDVMLYYKPIMHGEKEKGGGVGRRGERGEVKRWGGGQDWRKVVCKLVGGWKIPHH